MCELCNRRVRATAPPRHSSTGCKDQYSRPKDLRKIEERVFSVEKFYFNILTKNTDLLTDNIDQRLSILTFEPYERFTMY